MALLPAAGDAHRAARLSRTSTIISIYLVLAIAVTWPLVRDMPSRIAGDAGDPVLNAAVLVWNATTIPFSSSWWNAPHYYPTDGVSSFTENLVGLSPFASPIHWLTGNPILAYNLTLFLTWPLCALAAFLLVRFLTGRADAAFVAGLALGFTPYRAVGFAHLQTLAIFGLPLCLLGLHGFLETRRWPWLLLAGAAWLQQSLANGYYILFGGVVIALWVAYFCTTRRTWQTVWPIGVALAIASLPLAPMLLKYQQIHQQYGLHRTENEILYFSATMKSWFETSGDVMLWGRVFPDAKDDLFPGVTAVTLVMIGAGALLMRRNGQAQIRTPAHRWIRTGLLTATALSIIAIFVSLTFGRIDLSLAGIPIRMRGLDRALAVLLVCGIPLVLMTPRAREALARRSPLVFYAAATIVIAVFCFGPIIRAGDDVILSPAPYRWLMALPGFDELRIPTQFKMLGIVTLSVAAGLAYSALQPAHRRRSPGLLAAVVAGLLLDGWMIGAPMAMPPGLWPNAEPGDRPEPILELPIGVDDYAPTFRAAMHHRRTLNGVSGYDPPQYVALVAGLGSRDPAMLAAIASLGPFDIVVNHGSDSDGALTRYAGSAAGAVRVGDNGDWTVYRIPKGPPEPLLGAPIPIARVEAVRHEADWRFMHDGRIDTGWGDYPQQPDEWIVIDLGGVREVGGVTNAIGEFLLDFPRRLSIDVSPDAQRWERVWEGPTAAATFLAYVREPRVASIRFAFEARPARFVRLRQLESYKSMWRVSEVQVHAPATPLGKSGL